MVSFSLLAKPTRGGHGPTIPNLTNVIPRDFHPLPKIGITADTPSPSCRELLGQHYTETHYSADSTEITEKPDIQVQSWLCGEQFSCSCLGVPLCRHLVQTPFTPLLSLGGRITAFIRATCKDTPTRQ